MSSYHRKPTRMLPSRSCHLVVINLGIQLHFKDKLATGHPLYCLKLHPWRPPLPYPSLPLHSPSPSPKGNEVAIFHGNVFFSLKTCCLSFVKHLLLSLMYYGQFWSQVNHLLCTKPETTKHNCTADYLRAKYFKNCSILSLLFL